METICRIALSVQFASFVSVAYQMSQGCMESVYGWGGVWRYRKNRIAFERKRWPLPWAHQRLVSLLLSSLFFLSLSCLSFLPTPKMLQLWEPPFLYFFCSYSKPEAITLKESTSLEHKGRELCFSPLSFHMLCGARSSRLWRKSRAIPWHVWSLPGN